jgi:hypothetical protein
MAPQTGSANASTRIAGEGRVGWYGAFGHEDSVAPEAVDEPAPRRLKIVALAAFYLAVAVCAFGYGRHISGSTVAEVTDAAYGLETPMTAASQPSGFQSDVYSSDRMAALDRKGARWKVTYKKGDDESSWTVFHESDPTTSWKSGYKWATNQQSVSADGWSPCQPACGKSYKVREVACIRSDATVVDDSFCTGKVMPKTVEVCMNYSDCTPCWDVGAWSECGATGDCCGTCTKERSVHCRFCEPVTVEPKDVTSPLLRINWVKFGMDGLPANLDTSAEACTIGKVGICNEPEDWSAVNRIRVWNPPGFPPEETYDIEMGYDCTLLGNPVPSTGELWEEGALTSETHPTYPSTEYVHIGPFDRATGEPSTWDNCVNFCGCSYAYQYGEFPPVEDPHCMDNNWYEAALDNEERAGCILQEEGMVTRMASAFDIQDMSEAITNECGMGYETRWSRCCRGVMVGKCKTSGAQCVAPGPINEDAGNSHQASDFEAEMVCPYVEVGRFESNMRENGEIPVIERDECIDHVMMYECDANPFGTDWPPPEDRPENSRLVDGILAFIEGDSCEVVGSNECEFSLYEDTCRMCEDYSNCVCTWQCTPWCNHVMNMTVESYYDIDQVCFKEGVDMECPADCATTTYQQRQCWCRRLDPKFLTDCEADGVCTGQIDLKVIFKDAHVMTNSSREDWCCEDPQPETLQPCSTDEFCIAEPCVMEDFPMCGGPDPPGWCGNFLRERDINCCRADGAELDEYRCLGDTSSPDWELVMKIGEDHEFKYDSPYWENDAVLNELDEDAINRKLSAFNNKKFDKIRICFGYGFTLENPDFEEDTFDSMAMEGAPHSWTQEGNGVDVVKNDNPAYESMSAQSGTQFVSLHPQSGVVGTISGLIPGQLTTIRFGAASRSETDLATMVCRINEPVFKHATVGYGSFFQYEVSFVPEHRTATISIQNEAKIGDLLIDDVEIASDGWKMVAQELKDDELFNLRFLGHTFGSADDAYSWRLGGTSFNAAPDLRFGHDYNEVKIVYGDGDADDLVYEFAPLADIFTYEVQHNITIRDLKSNDGDLMQWVQEAGGAQFCKAASFANNSFPGQTSWGILPSGDMNRDCGCTGLEWAGHGTYYAGTANDDDDVPETPAVCDNSDTCGCYTGGFRGSGEDGFVVHEHFDLPDHQAATSTGTEEDQDPIAFSAEEWAADHATIAATKGLMGVRKYLAVYVRNTVRFSGAMDESSQNCIVYTFPTMWDSARSLFRAGEIRAEPPQYQQLDQSQWEEIFAEDANGCAMGKPGFNVEVADGNKARWGYFNNRPEDKCVNEIEGDFDAAVGIGLVGEDDPYGAGAGYTTYFVSDRDTYDAKSFRKAWLWVADTTQTQGISGFATLIPYDWNKDGTIVSDGFIHPTGSANECKKRCAEMPDCKVGLFLSGTTRFGECWLASEKVNATSVNTDFCGADETRQCVAFEKVTKLDLVTCKAKLTHDYMTVPGGLNWDLNKEFPTGERFVLVVDYVGHGKTPSVLSYADDNTTVAWGPATVDEIVSKEYSFGRETDIYWSEPELAGNPNITDEAFWSHAVCVYKFRSDPHPLTRWPGDVVDCEHPSAIKYMSEGSCRRACDDDEFCNGYGMWHARSEDLEKDGVSNGDFEVTSFNAEFITLAAHDEPEKFGWEIIEGDIDIIRATDNTVRDMPSGEKIVDLNGDEPGTISQVINTRIGQKYLLSFYASGNFEREPAQKTMNVFWSGCWATNCDDKEPEPSDLFSDSIANRVAQLTMFTGALTHADMRWKHYVFEVEATEDTSRVTFQSTTEGGGGFLLDKVELVLAAPMHDECAALGVDLDVEVVETQHILQTFCKTEEEKWKQYVLEDFLPGQLEHPPLSEIQGFLEPTPGRVDCMNIVFGGVSELWGEVPEELANCGATPNDAETTDPAGPMYGSRTWFKGVEAGGRAMTFTYKLTFPRRSTILNLLVQGTNFDGTEWKLTDGRGVVLSQRRFNRIAVGEGAYTVVSDTDYHTVDAKECETQYIIVPGGPQSSEELYYFAEHSWDAIGKLRSNVCVRTPTCYHHSEGTLYDDVPNGVVVDHLENPHPCTDGLVRHINYRDDAHTAVLKQDKCDPVSTAADRQFYGLAKPLGNNKAVTFAVKASGNVRIGMFTQQQPSTMPADPSDPAVNEDALVYTIVIDDESESFLRKHMTTENKVVATTVGYLTSADYSWFWADANFIGDSDMFYVRAGKGKIVGGDVFLKWQDSNPLPISHVAVSSWDVEGDWKVCSDQVYGEPHAKEVCVDLSDCLCDWSASVSDEEWENEVPCSEQCGDGTRSREVNCLITDCERNSPQCVIQGMPCPPFVITRSNDCVVKLYQDYAHGFGPTGDDKKYAEGWEITYGAHDKRNLKPAFKNAVKSVVIEGPTCSVLLFDGDYQTGSVQELRVPDGEEYHVFNQGFDMPDEFAGRANSLYVAQHNVNFCEDDTKPATQITCYETQGCCYVFSRCDWKDCYVPGDQCITEWDDEPDGIQHREVQCEMRKFTCDEWRDAVNSDEMAIANADGKVCTQRRYVNSIELATKTQCMEPFNDAQKEQGCPPSPAVFVGSELLECNANKDFDDVSTPICDGDSLTEDAPVCAVDDIDTDYAYSKVRQCGGSEVAYWMTCAWEPGAWSDCSGCGDVLQRRDTTCKRIDGEAIDCPGYILETYGKCCYHPNFHTNCGGCDEAGMPVHQQHCVDFSACQYEWHVKTVGHHSHSNCATFTRCVPLDDWMVDDRAKGSDEDQRAWCTEGPDRTHKYDAFVTYGLGACWGPDSKVETVADSGWNSPCPCYYGDNSNIDFGYHQLGDRAHQCKSNHKYAQRFVLDDPGMVTALSVDLEGVSQVKGAIYTDSGGRPDQRLYVTATASSKTNRNWVVLNFEQEGGVYLNGGFYWLTFQLMQDATCFGVEGDARGGGFKYMWNTDAFKDGNNSPMDPFDPFQTIETESAGFALFATYTSTGLKTHRETKDACDTMTTCEQCLDAVDVTDHTACIMTTSEGCQSTKMVEAEGLRTDLACQLTWGLKMYDELANSECGGEAIIGPNGETDVRRNTAEDCAQLCYKANAQYHEYNIGSFAAEPGNAMYCEAFEFDRNSRICRMLTNTKPTHTVGASCFVSKELGNPCQLEAGKWVRDTERNVYYVAESHGELVKAESELTCFGEPIWGGEDQPHHFSCDATVDANCEMCIEKSVSHNKMLGDMTCDNLYSKKKRVCQYDEADIECGKGETITVLEGSYGRFDTFPCGNPTVPPTNTEDMCGDANNVQQAVKTACNGKQMCTIVADDQTFGDQGCGHIYKYAEVRYQCVESK